MGFNYTQLVAELQSWPQSESAQYQAEIPTFIQLGETRLVRDLNLDIFDNVQPGIAVIAGSRLVMKPTDLIQTRGLIVINAGGVGSPLPIRSYDWCVNYQPDPSVQAQPKYACELNDTQWLVVATPDQNYTLSCHYVRRPPGLSNSNSNTFLGDKVGDCLLVACLMEAEDWLKADDRYQEKRAKYGSELLPAARAELRASIRSGDYSPYSPAAESTDKQG